MSSMANYNKISLIQKWLTQDPQPKPVLLLVAAMLILITKPFWNMISFDHDFVATAKQKIRFAAFAILLVGIYISCNIDGWINWKHSAFSRSPSASSCCYRATQWRPHTHAGIVRRGRFCCSSHCWGTPVRCSRSLVFY